MLYLRRALLGLGSGVGGPLHFLFIPVPPATLTQFAEKPRPTDYAAIHRKIVSQATPQIIAIHVVSLPSRSSKRHGPFVLGFTGGKA
jgi:hypothetical protein